MFGHYRLSALFKFPGQMRNESPVRHSDSASHLNCKVRKFYGCDLDTLFPPPVKYALSV
jgi:hypothetical protein